MPRMQADYTHNNFKSYLSYFLFGFFTILLMLNTAYNIAVANEKPEPYEIFDKLSETETLTLSLNRASSADLANVVDGLAFDSDLNKLDNPFENVSTYVSKDFNKLYVSPDNNKPGYPNYSKVEFRDHEGLKNLMIGLYTDLSTEALSFAGSNGHEVNLSVSSLKFLFELLAGYDKKGEDKFARKFDNKKIKLKKSNSDELDRFFESLANADNYYLKLAKNTDSELLELRNEVSNDVSYDLIESNNKDEKNADDDFKSYLSKDGSKLFVFINKDLALNSYVKIEKVQQRGGEDVKISLYTNLSHDLLNFDGSNSKRVNITFGLKALLESIVE